MRVLERHARPAVGVETYAEQEFLQACFLHIHQHGRGLGGALRAGVDQHRGPCVVAAVEQPLLRLQQITLAVILPYRQLGQTLGNGCVVTLCPLHLHRAVAVHGA